MESRGSIKKYYKVITHKTITLYCVQHYVENIQKDIKCKITLQEIVLC